MQRSSVDEGRPATAHKPTVRKILLEPKIDKRTRAGALLRHAVRHLAAQPSVADSSAIIRLQAKRQGLADKALKLNQGSGKVLVVINVLFDLKAQGWAIRSVKGKIEIRIENADAASNNADVRSGVRTKHLLERVQQLSLDSTVSFVKQMETPRAGPEGQWVSVHSLIRDGQELSSALRQARDTGPDGVRKVLSPYVQLVVEGERCPHTGILLRDIWRYFRLTWANSYKTVPGRNMEFLIRDSAFENHPIVGIASIGSPVVQQRERDSWIGWTADRILEGKTHVSKSMLKWMKTSVERLIKDVYWKDLILRNELTTPRTGTINRLRSVAKRARSTHNLFPHTSNSKRKALAGQTWLARAQSPLFKSKRAEALADLLTAKQIIKRFSERKFGLQKTLITDVDIKRAISCVTRHIKASHVGIDMADVTICGAIPPYNPVLGGKLVAMLLCSREVIQAYRTKYSKSASIIASAIAARPVVRVPNLVLLSTTSLYGVSPNQYDRIAIPSKNGSAVRFEYIGSTQGFGSHQFSAATVSAIEVLLARHKFGRRVNSIFGEGVNPRLRKIRAGLDIVGLPSDTLLRHNQKRRVYCVALASNFRDVLLGRARRPKYVLADGMNSDQACSIKDHWIARWLLNRIQRDDILESIACHTLAFPGSHSARPILLSAPADDKSRTLLSD